MTEIQIIIMFLKKELEKGERKKEKDKQKK